MTALAGMVQSFPQLVAVRIGVGIGEAGGSPPAHALISDYYPPRQRGRALSIYSMGAYLGVLTGFVAGGWLNQFFGWRTAFMVVGLPGFAVALLVRSTMQEPRRGQSDPGLLRERRPAGLGTHGGHRVAGGHLPRPGLFLALNLIGLGLGPLFTGLVSDVMTARIGPGGIRWAMAATCLAWLPAVACFYLASRTLRQDIALANPPT